jgi:hypothetical protein
MLVFDDPATGLHIEVDEGIDEKVIHLPQIKTNSKKAAKDIAEYARSIAPRESGHYAEGIDVQETKSGYRVIASDQKSAWIEFGIPSHNQPARWTLRTAAAALGYKFKKSKG